MKRFSVAFVAILVTLATSPSPKAADSVPAALPATVEVASAVEAHLAPTRWVPGSVVSRDDSRIASVVAGRVLQIAEVGALVREGQRLAKLDDTALRLRLEQSRAEIGRAKAQRDLAASQRARFDRLASGSIVAQAQIDEVRATLASAEHDVARADAERRSIEHELAETDIRAPFDGVVSERFVQRGEYLETGSAVAHLVDTRRLEARALAPLELAPQISAGDTVAVRIDDRTQPATIRATIPVGDERSRQFEVRIVLPDGYAPVGSAIEVALPEAAATSAIAVPRDALVLRDSQTYVMRVRSNDTAERVAVTAGIARESLIEILASTLAVGDRIVVRGAERLIDGQSVRVLKSS